MSTRVSEEAAFTISARMRSVRNSFSCFAEVIQVLEATYEEPNRRKKARLALRHLRYDWNEEFLIFLSRLNTIFYDAGFDTDT